MSIYKTYSEYLREIFPDFKVQKISVDAGFSCPNRDGTIGHGGCSYCNNASFSPDYCRTSGSVVDQISEGKQFFSRKYTDMKYLVYFQSYTNTHGRTPEELERIWRSAVNVPDIAGLIVSTRPDCLPDEVIAVMAGISRSCPVFLELGAESASDSTLERVNRHHTWADVISASNRASCSGLRVGLHLIAGLPGESRDDILYSVDEACRLPIESLKLHHLQVIRDTHLYSQWVKGDFRLLFSSVEDYMNFCVEIVERIPPSICIERFLASAPPALVAAPKWGMKNYEFVNALNNLLSL
ncbi:MAG: TIGR01212 family radical SAM protein [Muribaculaceae bacterium]|nr:TIGR01212 family radical SAM protein [Muribaculaceae bacterium]